MMRAVASLLRRRTRSTVAVTVIQRECISTVKMEEKEVDPGVTRSRHYYNAAASMMALVFHGVGKMPTLEDVPRPSLQKPTDVIIRVHKTTICGTDLHILGGNVPTTDVGRVLGHEGIGHVVAVGDAVQKWSVGDRVLTSCITGESQIYCYCVIWEHAFFYCVCVKTLRDQKSLWNV
jgi:hypothetical protein